jgi:hypothetical protein
MPGVSSVAGRNPDLCRHGCYDDYPTADPACPVHGKPKAKTPAQTQLGMAGANMSRVEELTNRVRDDLRTGHLDAVLESLTGLIAQAQAARRHVERAKEES